MGPKLKPGDKYTLKDGRVVEVVMNPFVLLGLENKGCNVCCLGLDEVSCLASRLLTPTCSYLIGYHDYFKWSEDNAEQSEDDNSREDKVSSEQNFADMDKSRSNSRMRWRPNYRRSRRDDCRHRHDPRQRGGY